MNRSRIMGCLAISLIFVLPAGAQLTPEQQRLKDEYIRQLKDNEQPVKANLIEQYKSPIKFTDQDSSFYLPPAGSMPIINTAESAGAIPQLFTSPDSLRIFGFNMFEGSAESFSPIFEASPPPDYRLGPGDNILINVWGRVDMQLDLTVDREGKVFIPKAGDVAAWGVTLDEFSHLVDMKLSSIYSGYQFSITLGKIRRIKVFVYGEVKRPGGYTTSSLSTLFNALYLAGGPNQTGSLRSIKHVRGNKVMTQVDLYQFLLNGDNSQDSRLESGDVIFVPVVGPLVRISGQIKRPAIYEISGGEKITDLLSLAGGPTSEAFLEMISVDRVGKDDSRIIEDVDLSSHRKETDPQGFVQNDFALKDGDRLRVPSLFDFRKNTVKLMGNVKHPGLFGLTDSMRVSDLIEGGEQFRIDTYLDRANLFRTCPDQRREVYNIDLGAILRGNDSTNYYLTDKDSLVVYSESEIKREMTVTISGSVRNPGRYEYFENMKLSDLIFLSGNPLKQSYMLRAEIARVVPGKPAELLYANLEKVLISGDSGEDLILAEDDNVFVRTIPRWRIYNSVEIEGEIMFPGAYEITKEGERLSDLLSRCGGFTPDAFPEGMVFLRKTISQEVEKRQARSILASTEVTLLDSLNRPLPKLNETLDISSADRIIINPSEVLKNPISPDNITLQRGDYIYVPLKPVGVQILGAVASNGTIVYKKGKKIDYFIKASGGFSTDAEKSQVRLAKSNGRVLAGNEACNSKVEPGDMIIVPQKLKKEKQWLRSASSLAAVTSTILTAFILINQVK